MKTPIKYKYIYIFYLYSYTNKYISSSIIKRSLWYANSETRMPWKIPIFRKSTHTNPITDFYSPKLIKSKNIWILHVLYIWYVFLFRKYARIKANNHIFRHCVKKSSLPSEKSSLILPALLINCVASQSCSRQFFCTVPTTKKKRKKINAIALFMKLVGNMARNK